MNLHLYDTALSNFYRSLGAMPAEPLMQSIKQLLSITVDTVSPSHHLTIMLDYCFWSCPPGRIVSPALWLLVY